MFEIGISSVPGSSSPPRYVHDITFVMLARALAAQETTGIPPRGKYISIEEGNIQGVEPSNAELKVEIGVLKQTIIEKDLLIGKLDV